MWFAFIFLQRECFALFISTFPPISLFVISFDFCVCGAINEYAYYAFLLFVAKCVDFQEYGADCCPRNTKREGMRMTAQFNQQMRKKNKHHPRCQNLLRKRLTIFKSNLCTKLVYIFEFGLQVSREHTREYFAPTSIRKTQQMSSLTVQFPQRIKTFWHGNLSPGRDTFLQFCLRTSTGNPIERFLVAGQGSPSANLVLGDSGTHLASQKHSCSC